MTEVSSTTILVRHLPADLTEEEKRDFFFHFGAERVCVFCSKGAMKHSAFLEFPDSNSAKEAIFRLHQLEVLGCRLSAELAKQSSKDLYPTDLDKDKTDKDTDQTKADNTKTETGPKVLKIVAEHLDESFKKHQIQFPRKASLNYLYPPPTVSTLSNIASALASHPRFYVQVLHLMNKMNIPAPFGNVMATPPLPMDSVTHNNDRVPRDITLGTRPIEDVEMEYSSSEESEIGSEGEVSHTTLSNADIPSMAKRRDKRPRKRMKLVQPDLSLVQRPVVIVNPSEVFEQPDHTRAATIQFHLSGKELESRGDNSVDHTQEGVTSTEDTCGEGGFGKIEPVVKPVLTEEIQKPDVNYTIDPKLFLSKSDVSNGCLTDKQLKDFSVFKKYQSGSATSRLYIKNMGKQTTEQDLVNIFGTYIDWSDQYAFNAFDIRLMKEGRMKGQAFVTLPDENSARSIVKHCNGFVLQNKPMVIQFARSAKPKEEDEKK